MDLLPILKLGKELIQRRVLEGDIVIDATCGNGHDTVFLAGLVGETGKVYGFDIQQQALLNTKQRLTDQNLLERVICIQEGHEHLKKWVHSPVKAAMFNLGYLPGSDKLLTTKGKTTVIAIEALLNLLTDDGIIVLIVYSGHDQGLESKYIENYLKELSQKQYSVMKVDYINQSNHSPYLIAIEKRK